MQHLFVLMIRKNCDIYGLGAYASIYSYQITTNGIVKTLVITDPSGNKIYYNNTDQLSTKETAAVTKTFKSISKSCKRSFAS